MLIQSAEAKKDNNLNKQDINGEKSFKLKEKSIEMEDFKLKEKSIEMEKDIKIHIP